ncbi:MAG: hypothetical protein WC667_13180 [Sulfurimonas sp.]|jgi:hypothetical protein
MKYFKSLFFVIAFSNILNADFLIPEKNTCVSEYYFQADKMYYRRSDTHILYFTTNLYSVNIKDGYDYNSTTDMCIPHSVVILGMDYKDFNFLLGLIGVIIGGVFMFFTIDAFIKVGGKK